MKKLLLSLATIALAATPLLAEEIIITWADEGYANAEDITEIVKTPVTLTFSQGTNKNNPPKYYTTGSGFRMYKDNELTVEVPAGYSLESIDFTASGTGYLFAGSANCGEMTTEGTVTTWTADEATTEVIFTTSATCRVQTTKITYSEIASDKQENGLAFPEEEYTAELFGSFTAPVLENPHSLTGITYSSTNADVASVNEETGAITLVGVGQTVISASFPGDDTYKAGIAQYILKVVDNRQVISLSFPEEFYTVNLNEEFTAPVLSGLPAGLSVIYVSSDETVATVNSVTGEVIVEGKGQTIISALFGGNNEYQPAQAQYTLTVVDPNNLEVIFDFVNNDYGMERLSGSTQQYNPENTQIVSAPVTLIVNEHTRLWSDGLRFYKDGEMYVTIANGYVIDDVTYSNKNGQPTITNVSVPQKKDNGEWYIKYTATSSNSAMSTLTVSYSKDISDGVAVVEADNSEAVYFDLSGRRVQGTPEKGLYIKVCGEKVTKVIL